jgi:hypothetical protein
MTAQAFVNKYAQLLDKQGNYVVTVKGIDWYEYSGFMIPAYLPHCVPNISYGMAEKVLEISGKPFVRWDNNLGQVENSEWWYILKKGPWNIEDVSDKKKRWMIKQGIKNFTTRPLIYDKVVKLCPEITLKATTRYKGKTIIETEGVLIKRIEAGGKVPDVLEYIGCFYKDKLVSFAENYIQDNAVWMAVIRHDPEHLKNYSSYGLMNGILEYYLNEKKFKYVLDGCRNIHHKTQFQEHLIKVFGFTKEYAYLNIVYSSLFGVLVKMTYPFKRVFENLSIKINNSFIDNINAILKQEYIRRTCQ